MKKLVRDKIPQIIRENNQQPLSYVAEEQEYRIALHNKMLEELEEFWENPSVEEAADMYEVWLATITHWGFHPDDVVTCANNKRHKNGGFRDRIILQICTNGD